MGADDDRLQIRARVGTTGVAAGELYFHTKTAVVQVNRPDINNCPAPQLDSAKDLCKKKEHKFVPSMSCLVAVCFGSMREFVRSTAWTKNDFMRIAVWPALEQPLERIGVCTSVCTSMHFLGGFVSELLIRDSLIVMRQ